MSVLTPREPRQDELELLIREARARQRRRRMLVAAAVAVTAAAALSARAAITVGSARQARSGGSQAPLDNRAETGRGRVPIVEVGSSGGVTWAINGVGMWLTTDGGRSWRASLPRHVATMGDAIARVQQVQFLDPRHGWVVAVDVRGGLPSALRRHAEIDRTSDGGRTWHSAIPAGCCGDVSFVTPRLGYMSGRSLLQTRSGGATWTRVARPPFAFGALAFTGSRHGVAVLGKPSALFRTTDAGRRWAAVHRAGSQSLLPPVAVFGSHLVLPAERVKAQRLDVYVSANGGSTWTVRPAPHWWTPLIGSNDAQMFSAVSPTLWFAAGRQKLIMTTDAGRTWRLVKVADLPRRWTITAIDFTTPRVGWAIFSSTRSSVLMRTTDGGRHWTPAGPPKRKVPHR